MKRTALDILDERMKNNPELKRAYEKEKTKMNTRTLTIVIEFDKENPPAWVWASHMTQDAFEGVLIKSISEGNQLKSDQDYEDDE